MKKENTHENMIGNYCHSKKKTLQITVWKSDKYSDTYSIQKSYKKKDSTEWVRETVKLFSEDFDALYELMTEVISGSPSETSEPQPKQQKFIETTHAAAVADDDIPF